jgi:hypothetical protein
VRAGIVCKRCCLVLFDFGFWVSFGFLAGLVEIGILLWKMNDNEKCVPVQAVT